ncbi:3,4-dihydroxy-2-butanone-4-phosphate synthase [Rhodococcus pyridinivorans]|uniref:3,4-dihydroxy-2-butanone-4-phosphate synthase n=1 Tax=Rhodococcus TaxID=1827 RepID=UPI001C7CD57F|nr:3,4-dihydroxy-2-butanone-4-phosphate synthase [Rhodococcus sp. DMU2021]MBX4171765.1 3,4-dihydroxy-2-butanone-4-phosphate synthase [Rhodococcus sp. DMU2021]
MTSSGDPSPAFLSSPDGRFTRVENAIVDVREGKPIVVIDSENTGEGDLVCAARTASTAVVSFLIRHSSGYICVALPNVECDRLHLPAMYADDPSYRVSVDCNESGTGISAYDRAATMRMLADPTSNSDDFTRPGHVVPIRASEGGVLAKAGRVEAASDISRLAGLGAVGALGEIVSEIDPHGMATTAELVEFAHVHGLTYVYISDLVAYRLSNDTAGFLHGAEVATAEHHLLELARVRIEELEIEIAALKCR